MQEFPLLRHVVHALPKMVLLGAFVLPSAFAAPKARVEPETLNFGAVKNDAPVSKDVTVYNDGDSPLEIFKVQASCGCSKVTIPADDTVIVQPGGSFALPVEFNPANRFGKQTAVIAITTNDPAKPAHTVTVTAVIEAVAVVRPVNGLVWQQTPRGGEIRRTVVIAPGDPLKDIEVLEVKSDRPELVIAANKVERNTQRMIDLKFALADTTPLGNFSATVTVRVRVEGEESTLTVPVRGDVVGDIVVTPQELNVTRAPTARGERLGGLLVRGSGAGDAPRIRAVLAEGAVRAEISKGQSAEQPHVDVYVSDDAPGGAQQAYVYVVTTSTDQPVVQIPVYFVAPMLVEALPAAVVFEGDDTVQRVEIKDFNGAPVSITRATSAHDSVSVSVDASATGQIEVRRGAAALRELRDTQVIIETTMPGALRITIPVAIRE